ncbi:metalloprotease [Coemansia aciculifera]|uniref:Metalloprotease n=1 Tax=Coemansia aciculifera TaxID=417176 RepID=A0A9W8IIM2_9FUNG|nr:metalloprotease [Coemansia aciculifera]
MDFCKNYPLPDWTSGFEHRKTSISQLPYEEYTGPMEKSASDTNSYRLIRLPNNLVVMCVQDVETGTAAATLSVSVGSNMDPVELQGLAHLLEHMLFRGTEKYPDEGEYKILKQGAKDHGIDLHEELLKFYNKYYSSDIMRLAIYGNHSLDRLVELAASKFSDIKKGLEHYEDIMRTVFAYVRMLVSSGPQEWAQKEMSSLMKVAFDSKQKPKPINQVLSYMDLIFNEYLAPEHVLSKDKMYEKFDYDAILHYLSFINSANFRVFLGARKHKSVEYSEVEPYFGVAYHAKTFKADSAQFSVYLALYTKGLGNVDNLAPAKLCEVYRDYITKSSQWHYKLVASEMAKITLDKIQAHVDSLFDVTFIKMCMVGNFDEKDVLKAADNVQDIIKPSPNFGFIHEMQQQLIDITDEELDDLCNKQISILQSVKKEELLEFWNKYTNPSTAPAYTRIDVQMWSTKIWKPTVCDFKKYSAKTLALYGCLHSEGNDALDVGKVDEFITTAIAARKEQANASDDSGSLIAMLKSASLSASGAMYTAGKSAERATHTGTALVLAINDHETFGNYADVSHTNFATIGMNKSPDGIWLMTDCRKFQATQQLYGLKISEVAIDQLPKYN